MMKSDPLQTRLDNARQPDSTPPMRDVTAWVLDDIRRLAPQREDAAVWRWASTAAVAIAIVGLGFAAPAWDRIENPFSDFVSVLPTENP